MFFLHWSGLLFTRVILRNEFVLLHCRMMCVTCRSGVVAQMGTRQYRKIHVDTEVWSWGSGDRGQLGHADLLDRLDLQDFL